MNTISQVPLQNGVPSAYFIRSILTMMIIAFGFQPCKAVDITVDQDGTADFTTIAEAIAAANPGDNIIVNPGTYNESLSLPAFSLSIQSSDPTNPEIVLATRINPGVDGIGFSMNGSDAEAMAVINGFAIDSADIGLELLNGSKAVVENCIIAGHQFGGALVKSQSDALFRGCVFASNDSDVGGGTNGTGGGISICNSKVRVEGCDFSDNCASLSGGAIFASDFSEVTVLACDFSNNKSLFAGGAITSFNSTLLCFFNDYNGNTSDVNGGAITIERSKSESTDSGSTPFGFRPDSADSDLLMPQGLPESEILDCTFNANVCLGSFFQEGGGAIACSNASPVIANCTFSTNDAPSGQGGAIFNFNQSSPLIQSSNFLGNTARIEGGAIKNRDRSNPVIMGCSFEMNATTNVTSHRGGAINNSGSTAFIDDCSFQGNQSRTGGAIYNEDDVDGNPGILMFAECDFNNNLAELGGAVFNFIGGAEVTISECNFNGNMATLVDGRGGAIFNRAILSADNSSFENNIAGIDGGGIHNDLDTTLKLSQCIFMANVAMDDGGAVHSIGDGSTVESCTFESNSCGDNGGAVFLNGASTVFQFCGFLANEAADLGAGIASFNDANESVINCSFFGGIAGLAGGGACTSSSDPRFFGCQFNGNMAEIDGGGIAHINSISQMTNCSFTLNVAQNAGGAISGINSSQLAVANCILWENGTSELFTDDSSSNSVSFSIVQVAGVGAGINTDPLFVNPLGNDGIAGTGDENLSLQPGSPAIDAGDNNALPLDETDLDNDGNMEEPMPLDLTMKSRFVDDPKTADTGNGGAPLVDIGAFEFPIEILLGDVNLDGAANLLDVDPFIDRVSSSTFQPEADTNQDGSVNLLDVEPFIGILGGQ